MEKKNVAVIGCGHWGRNLVRVFHQLGALAAVSDADPARTAEFAEKYGVQGVTPEQAVALPGVDGVVIAAPAELHANLGLAALAAGKHLYVEKPLALRAEDAAQMIASAERGGRILMVGHLLQYHPAFLKLKEMVAKGELGRLQYVYSNRLNLGKIRREENVFWSFAPHDISMILSLVGEEPELVTATGASYLHKAIADVTTTHLSFPSGVSAHIFVSWLHPFKEQKLVVVGDQKMAVFDDRLPWGEKLQLFAHRIGWRNGQPEPVPATGEAVHVQESEPLAAECRHFLDCMSSGARPRTDGAEGLRVLRVLDAATRAMEQGASVRPGPAAVAEGAAPKQDFWVHESAYVDEGCTVGAGSKVWHFSHLIKGTALGRNCVVGQNVVIGPDVKVGDNCKIQNNVSLYTGVTLEDGVFCGPSCVFTNVMNPRAEVNRKSEYKATLVRRGTTIGANATIVCGTTLGAYSFIAAGAVVTKDVPAHALMAGVPARRIGWMSHAGHRLGDDLVCPGTGRRYAQSDDDTLVEIAPVENTKV